VYPRRCGTHAHDQETAAGGRGGRRGPHCGRTILRLGRFIPPQTRATAPSRPPKQNLRHSPRACRLCVDARDQCTGMRRAQEDRMRHAVEDEVVKRAALAGDAAHSLPALWGVTDAGAGCHVACCVLKPWRASNFQLPPCFCQTCRTLILALVGLPSVSLSDAHVWRAIASLPATAMV